MGPVAGKSGPSLGGNVEDSEGERGSVQSPEHSGAKPDMADKAVTVGEGASPDAPEEFSPCYDF